MAGAVRPRGLEREQDAVIAHALQPVLRYGRAEQMAAQVLQAASVEG
jgi:hypothetical protein